MNIPTLDVLHRVVLRTSAHEGGADAVNANTDGAGLSWGLAQWTQHSGNLGVLLAAMNATDPALFATSFGPASAELLRVTRSSSESGRLAPVAGARLWQEPWLSRFRAAGRHPTWAKVQLTIAATGEHMSAALDAAKIVNLGTERAVSMFFDTAIQQGPAAARRVAREVVAQVAAPGTTVSTTAHDLLTRYARTAAAPFRRNAPPSSSRMTWKQLSDGLHYAYAGSVQLYGNILKRRTAILNDPHLSDRVA